MSITFENFEMRKDGVFSFLQSNRIASLEEAEDMRSIS